ncbi:MAG: gamma-glutamyltransferase [Rhodospirillaceae bacterium]|jgi:gamma-glutamyltranspeptidase|nr:gamma-glutamyltransferase [Rhodospirillaceae bacterium]MBT6137316.1 gamma-glutamyltransferase [Rhodospirillaceae bacterium]
MDRTVRAHRPLIMGRNGAVASNHPQATLAGMDVLRAGGNAVDAAAAVSLALGVVEPGMSGLGGDGFFHVWMAETGNSHIYNGTGSAPSAAKPERFAEDGIPVVGPLSTSTPGHLGGLSSMHAAHGVHAWPEVCAHSIRLAQEGFLVTHAYRHYAETARDRLVADPVSRVTLLDDGEIPALGTAIQQPRLAETLSQIATDGAESFYRGTLADQVAKDMEAAGILVTAADLAAYQPEIQDAIAISYRGFEVRQTPPNSTGFVLLQELKIIEQFDLTDKAYNSAEVIHLLVEAKKRAFRDRERHGADPRHTDIPIDRLLSEKYAADIAAEIDLGQAAEIPLSTPQRADGDTTYFCVVDDQGNAVSAIQSINSAFGSGVTGRSTGILFNNRMAYWHLDEAHANRLVPGKRVRHTMNAPIILRDGKLWAAFGTPGADNQVQVNLQIAVAMMDYDLDPQQAVEATRWASSQPGQGANWPHDGDFGLTVEEGLDAGSIAGLRGRGHDVRFVAPLEGPCSVACIRVLENGTRMAGSDPRRDGWAGAY